MPDQAMVISVDDGSSGPVAPLTDLQDLPRAATLIVRSLDAVLDRLEALKVCHTICWLFLGTRSRISSSFWNFY